MEKIELFKGDVVQLNEKTVNKFFIGALMIVTDLKSFGAQGAVHGLGKGTAYYRAKWEEMDYVGRASLIPE